VLLGELGAERGSATVLGALARTNQRPRWLFITRIVFVVLSVLLCALAVLNPPMLASLVQNGVWSPLLLITILEIAYRLKVSTSSAASVASTGKASDVLRKRGVAYISSEHEGGQKLDGRKTVEDTIAKHMRVPKQERRKEVLAALRASGFQLYGEAGVPRGDPEQYLADNLKVGELSGGQRHLVYVLSVLASQPRLLIADEMLCGLDIDRQSNMLGLLQKMQLKYGMAILYLTVDATSFSIIANDGAFMHEGRFVEARPAHLLLEQPEMAETKHYLRLSSDIEERSKGKNLRNAYATGESVFNL